MPQSWAPEADKPALGSSAPKACNAWVDSAVHGADASSGTGPWTQQSAQHGTHVAHLVAAGGERGVQDDNALSRVEDQVVGRRVREQVVRGGIVALLRARGGKASW